MTRGYSLEQDLRLLLNNPKYSDIEILCKDEVKLYGCRAILAARSEMLDSLLYNGMRESYESQITFPEIDASGMEIILEYIYTGSIKNESLTKDNIIETFHAADYFQLPDLQDFIMKTVKNADYSKVWLPELLSKVADTCMTSLSEDNMLLNLLVEEMSIMSLNTIEFGRLSIAALQYLLSCTYHGKEKPFETPEYEVFRYSAILAAREVSNYAYETLVEQLPTLEQLENSAQIEHKCISDHQEVAKELEPLVKFINFKLIKGQILTDIIDPLKIIPAEIILNEKLRSNNSAYSNEFRGIPKFKFNESDLVWDELTCGSKLIIEDNGKIVRASSDYFRNVRAKVALDKKGIFKWDVIIEKACNCSWVGVCASENFDYETYYAGYQQTGWVLGSSGNCCNKGSNAIRYCPSFGDGAKITVHLDMNKRTIAFTVNGTKYSEVSGWNNLPSKLYPVVSLRYPGRFRIQSHQKFDVERNSVIYLINYNKKILYYL